MKKELKKQIKEDELLGGIDLAWRWTLANQKLARTGLVAIVVALVLAGGVSFLRGRRDALAVSAFEAAMLIYETPYASELSGPPEDWVAPFASKADKFTKAAAAFDGVERGHPAHALGRRARYYAALCRIELGDGGAASKALKSLTDAQPASSLEGALARVALADLQRRSNAWDGAVEAYRVLVEDKSLALPRDYVLLSLASCLEGANRTTEAVASYRRLYEQFPESVYAQEAQRRAAYLRPESRG